MEAKIIDLRPFSFANLSIYSINFPLTSLATLQKFQYVVFIQLKYFPIFLFIYFLIHGLFSSLLVSK